MDQSRNQAEIKSAMDGYYKIIHTLQDKIQSNNTKMEDFNKSIEQNFKQIETLKGDESLISSFKTEMKQMQILYNDSIIKDNYKCHTLISETEENIKLLEKTFAEVSKMGLTQLEPTL